ncbi:hypothetical protein [Coraliomargarita akajimensis]|uniref:Uncharacterized protein n=1 Tax=Coraliomargarita akajimensis (strain DSM 45221 / IAM 15411 / JCM 23193 / KCTC 12865 / 04OKA010-24) TaxID=583355 RepID=D5EI36_CORAD|nr:hypothetical protein [Coraliomargarita akajimensis]ADE56076.1 hypothetical protein Caka_3063 [Coraliomargarita akajimensis DSM 45221]
MYLSLKARSQILLMVVAMIAVAVGSAFGIVWMQQQINRTARNCQKIEREMEETMRRMRYLDERIASVHQPVVLQGRVAGVLRPALESQVVWVREQEITTGRRAYAQAAPYEVGGDLAYTDFSANQR